MGRIDKFNDTTAEAHNIWTSPNYRGARAQGLYKKLGYYEIEKYSQTRFQNESLKKYYNEKISWKRN
jgi:ribosomal protein S18 acetylase RimI-like enzyme